MIIASCANGTSSELVYCMYVNVTSFKRMLPKSDWFNFIHYFKPCSTRTYSPTLFEVYKSKYENYNYFFFPPARLLNTFQLCTPNIKYFEILFSLTKLYN